MQIDVDDRFGERDGGARSDPGIDIGRERAGAPVPETLFERGPAGDIDAWWGPDKWKGGCGSAGRRRPGALQIGHKLGQSGLDVLSGRWTGGRLCLPGPSRVLAESRRWDGRSA